MKGEKRFYTVSEFDLDAENCGAEIQIVDQDGRQWISLVIDGGESSYDLSMGDAGQLAAALKKAIGELL